MIMRSLKQNFPASRSEYTKSASSDFSKDALYHSDQIRYDQLVEDASKETTDLKVRYEKYAKAQAWLKDSALYLPTTAYSGAATVVSRIQPFSGAYA